MARKQRRRKKQTKTEQYNTLRTGLQFFGIDIKELKKATTKAIKAAQKIYKGIRKQLQSEGVTDLPNIRQLAKQVREQEKQSETPSIPQPETREPLPYASDEEVATIDFSSPILDEFLEMLNEAMTELAGKYGSTPQIWKTMSALNSEIISTFNKLRVEMGDDNLAEYINSSLEYDALRTITMYSYNDAVNALDGILSNLSSLLNEAKQYNESPQFIAPTTITFE